MTNEEVIRNVKTAFEWWEDNARMEEDEDWSRQHEALDMAIKALETASCIKEKCAYCPHCEHCDVDDDTLEIKALEQQQKTGHWIRQTDNYHDYYECEQCGIAVGLDDIKNYCPNCGCRMKGEGE